MATLAPFALISISEARNHMADEEADAERLADLINGYSRQIRLLTQRQFYAEAAATKSFSYNGLGSLDFAPFELRVLTSVSLAGTLLDPILGHFQLQPVGKSLEGTWQRILFPEAIGDAHVYGPRPLLRFGYEVIVVGDWGMTAVPEDAALACKIAVANGYRNPEGYSRRTTGPVIGEEATAEGGRALELPPDALELLEGLTRHAVTLAP